ESPFDGRSFGFYKWLGLVYGQAVRATHTSSADFIHTSPFSFAVSVGFGAGGWGGSAGLGEAIGALISLGACEPLAQTAVRPQTFAKHRSKGAFPSTELL